MRPLGNGGYQNSCGPGCGCDDDLEDLETSGSFFMPKNDQKEEENE